MSDVSRRQFLKWSSAFVGASMLPGCARSALLKGTSSVTAPAEPALQGQLAIDEIPTFAGTAMGQLVMPSLKSPRDSYGAQYKETGNVLNVIDFAGKQLRWVATPLKRTHSAMLVPGIPHSAVAFEKDGPLGCLVDLRGPSVSKVVLAKPGWNFNGHGVFSADGAFLYDTEYNQANKDESAILVRDGKTFEILGELNSHGYQPHDLRFIHGGTQLVVGHYGHIPTAENSNLEASITVIDMPSGKLLERIPSSGDNHQLCHLAATDDGRIIVSTQNFLNKAPEMKNEGVHLDQLSHQEKLSLKQQHFPSPVMIGVLGKNNGKLESFMPKEMESKFTFNFSTAIHDETSVAGVAHISGNYVSFWDLNTGKMLSGTDVKASATGLTLSKDRQWFIATSGSVIHFFDVRELKHRGAIPLKPNLSAPHVLII